LANLFPSDEGLPCREGTALRRGFAEYRSSDFAFLKPNDLVDLSTSAFDGIAEWGSFSTPYGSCEGSVAKFLCRREDGLNASGASHVRVQVASF
jgi:hypothetical protein